MSLNDLTRSWNRIHDKKLRASFEAEQAVSFMVSVSAQVEEFKKLHRALRWFYTPWAEAETETFLAELFESESSRWSYESLNITVGFTEEYNFVNP
jgi:hypothetical protein